MKKLKTRNIISKTITKEYTQHKRIKEKTKNDTHIKNKTHINKTIIKLKEGGSTKKNTKKLNL